jgi:hypothetical protein
MDDNLFTFAITLVFFAIIKNILLQFYKDAYATCGIFKNSIKILPI